MITTPPLSPEAEALRARLAAPRTPFARLCRWLDRLALKTSTLCPQCRTAAQSGRWAQHLCPLEAAYPTPLSFPATEKRRR